VSHEQGLRPRQWSSCVVILSAAWLRGRVALTL
jgi:hypothetical protein